MATAPFALHWSLTTPETDTDGDAKTYQPSAMPTLNIPDYFLITDDYVKLRAPVAGTTTAKSEKTRSELREYTADGSAEQNWLGNGGNHSIGAALVVKDVPDTPAGKGSVFIGQIHADGGDSPLLKFKYQSVDDSTSRLIVSFRADPGGDASDTVVMTGVAKTARIQYYAKVNASGQLSAYYEVDSVRKTFTGDLSTWLQKRPAQKFYFKAGVYNNALPSTSTGADDTSEAWFYKLTTTHS